MAATLKGPPASMAATLECPATSATATEPTTPTTPAAGHAPTTTPTTRNVMLDVVVNPGRCGRNTHGKTGSGVHHDQAKEGAQCRHDFRDAYVAPHTTYAG